MELPFAFLRLLSVCLFFPPIHLLIDWAFKKREIFCAEMKRTLSCRVQENGMDFESVIVCGSPLFACRSLSFRESQSAHGKRRTARREETKKRMAFSQQRKKGDPFSFFLFTLSSLLWANCPLVSVLRVISHNPRDEVTKKLGGGQRAQNKIKGEPFLIFFLPHFFPPFLSFDWLHPLGPTFFFESNWGTGSILPTGGSNHTQTFSLTGRPSFPFGLKS